MTEPMDLFREWHRDVCSSSTVAHPNAMCLATVDEAGLPHARIVDLKSVRPEGFVFCTSHASPKSHHIRGQPGVSLTFWWDHIGRQVRVLGHATRIADHEADDLFGNRSRDAQLASWASDQSQPLDADDRLADRAASTRKRFADATIPRPPHWGGYLVAPRRMEFLTFHEDRMHRRVAYVMQDSRWVVSELQP